MRSFRAVVELLSGSPLLLATRATHLTAARIAVHARLSLGANGSALRTRPASLLIDQSSSVVAGWLERRARGAEGRSPSTRVPGDCILEGDLKPRRPKDRFRDIALREPAD